jgi:hypothetical protein
VKPRQELLTHETTDAEFVDFMSYVHIGELAVNRDFAVYSQAKLPGQIRTVFGRAGMDEGQHEMDTGDIVLGLLGGDRAKYRWKLFRASVLRGWRVYLDTMNRVGGVPLTIMLSAIYFAFGWIAAPSLRRRLTLASNEQLQVFKHQVQEFES